MEDPGTLDDLVRREGRYILTNLMSWQAATGSDVAGAPGAEKYVTAQMYYSLVGRGLEYEFSRLRVPQHRYPGLEPLAVDSYGQYSRATCPWRDPVRGCRSVRALRQRDGLIGCGSLRRWPPGMAQVRRVWRLIGCCPACCQQRDHRCPES